jgi:hypothetical protein
VHTVPEPKSTERTKYGRDQEASKNGSPKIAPEESIYDCNSEVHCKDENNGFQDELVPSVLEPAEPIFSLLFGTAKSEELSERGCVAGLHHSLDF